jgi:outer membrane protein TolC
MPASEQQSTAGAPRTRGQERLGAAALLAATLLFAPPVPAQAPAELSLADALARSAEHHPAAVAARFERAAREADVLGSAAAFLPQLSAELGGVRSDDPVAVFGAKLRQGRFAAADFALSALNFPNAVGDVSAGLSLEQPIFQPAALSGRRAAKAGARAGRLAETRAGQLAAFETLRAYFGARLAAERVAVLEESLAAARRTLGQVEKLHREGVVTLVDEQLARSRTAELEAALAAAGAGRIAAEDFLLQLLGWEPGRAVALTDSLAPPTESPADSSARPDLAALSAALEARNANVLGARSTWLPSIAAFGNLSWHDRTIGVASGPRRWTAGVTLRWTPFRGLSELGALHRAQAEREAARAELETAERRAAAEVRSARAERGAAIAGYVAADAALAHAVQAARAAETRYAEGAATITELLAVRAAESSERLARLQGLYQARVADAALTLALGGTPR